MIFYLFKYEKSQINYYIYNNYYYYKYISILKIKYIILNIFIINKIRKKILMGIGDWGLGIGACGVGGGGPTPTPPPPPPPPHPPPTQKKKKKIKKK